MLVGVVVTTSTGVLFAPRVYVPVVFVVVDTVASMWMEFFSAFVLIGTAIHCFPLTS